MLDHSHTSRSLVLKNCVEFGGKPSSFSVVENEDSTRKDSEIRVNAQEARSRAWKTTTFRFGPLSGIFCMVLAATRVVVSLGILAGSDGQEIDKWPTPPSTYLAIFTAVGNLSMRYAAIQGVVIAWWTRALRGSTLSRLHWDWRSGTTLRGALTAGRHMGLLGLACIFSTIVVIDGPLLQRSSTVVTAPITGQPLPLNITMAPELPSGYTGVWTTAARANEAGLPYNLAYNDTIPTPNGAAKNNIYPMSWPRLDLHVSALWSKDEPLEGVVEGCADQCTVEFLAPALFTTSCIREQHAISYVEYFSQTDVLKSYMAPPLKSQAFSIGINLLVEEEIEKIVLITKASTTVGRVQHHEDCNSTLEITSCIMEAGVGEYHVLVKNNKLQMDSLGPPRLIAMSNNTKVEHSRPPGLPYYRSTLGGIVEMMMTRWMTTPKGSNPSVLATVNDLNDEYFKPGNQECPTYLSAREDVINSLNKLMVYFGAFAAHHIRNHWKHEHHDDRLDPDFGEARRAVEGYPAGIGSIFQTHYHFFIAAAVVELVCLALVAPTYWGWWNIGRPVSFSPLELSKAFDSSVLSHCDSNSSGRDLAKAFGDTPIKYGTQVGQRESGAKIVFGDPENIMTPAVGERFGQC